MYNSSALHTSSVLLRRTADCAHPFKQYRLRPMNSPSIAAPAPGAPATPAILDNALVFLLACGAGLGKH